ncbi:fatty acid desaturase [Micromonospora sp. NPDC049102]|uniref:fatty acid desaturase n=1 Tax=Micromonospora sp. NPDC049102 TaxID=3364265 RepID=UPI0037220AEE
MIDLLLGDDRRNPPEEVVPRLAADGYYRWLTHLYLPAQYAALVVCCAVWTRDGLSVAGAAGPVATVGVVDGIAINTAHELGHKRERVERWLSKVALAPAAYGHLHVEHNRGHHVRVATPEDPASSRLGESFWAFWPRTVLGSLRSAWRLETGRFRVRGSPCWRSSTTWSTTGWPGSAQRPGATRRSTPGTAGTATASTAHRSCPPVTRRWWWWRCSRHCGDG